jgi:hypothetical protein
MIEEERNKIEKSEEKKNRRDKNQKKKKRSLCLYTEKEKGIATVATIFSPQPPGTTIFLPLAPPMSLPA